MVVQTLKLSLRCVLMVVALCLTLLQVWATPPTPPVKFHHLSIEQGLSQSSILCIWQDQQGFLWFGTQDGLNRYDGYTFLVYRNDPQLLTTLSSNRVGTLFQDQSKQLWVGTNNGLNRFDPSTGTFTRFLNQPQDPTTVSSNRISAICEDQTGRLWIGTADQGLNCLNPTTGFKRFQHQPHNANSLSGDQITALFCDRAGVLWIGTAQDGLNRFDPTTGNFIRVPINSQNPSENISGQIRVISEDQTGALWVGTADQGLFQIDRTTGTTTHFFNDPANPLSLSNNSVRALLLDRKGAVWIGTDTGLNRFDPSSRTFSRFVNDPRNLLSLSHNDIRSVYEDQAGSLWVGTLGGGVNRLDQTTRTFVHYFHDPRSPQSLGHNGVRALYADAEGIVWIGTNGGGLDRLDRATGTIRHFTSLSGQSTSLSSNRVWSICPDKSGDLWVGTLGGGLNRFNRKTETALHYTSDPANPTTLSHNNVVALCPSRKGGIWVGTTGGGLNYLEPDTGVFTRFAVDAQNPQGLSSQEVLAIFEDKLGMVWIGTADSGLNCYDPQRNVFTRFQPTVGNPNSINSNTIRALYEDRAGVLWVGTDSGLNRFDRETQTFTAFTIADGLPNNVIYGILEDWAGNLWLSTNTGLCKFHTVTHTCHNYDLRDGLQSNEFNTGTCFQNAQGEMFFGGINGFNVFHPETILDNPFIPPVVITSFRKLNQQMTGADLQQVIELRYFENLIAFEFAALNYTLPEKNQYAYRLEGFDKNWILCGDRRYASYTNLEPGTYVFCVKGSNNDGVWNETGIKVRLRVIPPPWKTWWAYSFYLILISLAVFGGYRFQVNRVQARVRLHEARLRAETAEAQAQSVQARAEAIQIEARAAARLAEQNAELDRKNKELERKNEELVASQQQADRIFSALAEALPGTVLDGKYRLDEKIGAGGFGAVFQATHLQLNRLVAVKVFKPKPGNDSADAIERFRQEGISTSRLNHINAIQVLDSGISSEGIAYLVMELLQGHTLADEIRTHRLLPLHRCAEINAQICDALAEAHRLGIIHRDIKPENVFLNQTPVGEVVKVLDFGIAKMLSEDTDEEMAHLTATGGLVGTPLYMAPERLERKPYDGRSDVYSAGIMVYEMLTGKTPFDPGSKGLVGIVMAHLRQTPPPLRQFFVDLPAEIESIVMSALEKNPQSRPTAKEFGEHLSRAVLNLASSPEITIVVRPGTTTENTNLPTVSLQFSTISDIPTGTPLVAPRDIRRSLGQEQE
ncbi:MAG TPA: two-component regulator propeller domain-containing protein [Acidobacteriota bacterium]|nr:two-component regulator propeller domain-containing protein [Acidobacteriota bacterium]